MPEERERDTEWRASESVEERKLHCSRRRQRDGDQREACYAQQREGHLQQEQQRVREWHPAETQQGRGDLPHLTFVASSFSYNNIMTPVTILYQRVQLRWEWRKYFTYFFLCTNRSVFRSYFDPRLLFSPGIFRS